MTLSEKVARILEGVCAGEIEKAGVPVGTVSGNYRKVSDNPSKWEWITRKNPPKSDVKHDGEYVLTKSGSKDFGEITPEVAKIIRRQAGKIRLRIGEEHGKASKENYGEKHIEREERMKQIRAAGFDNARDFVEYVCNDFDAIYNNGLGLIIARNNGNNNAVAYIQIMPSEDGDFYDVKTATPARLDFKKNIKPLWSKSGNGFQQSESERAQSNQFKKESPLRSLSGNSDNSNIPSKSGVVKKAFIHNGRLYIHKSWLKEIKEA